MTKIEVCITRAARLSRETFCECIIAVWCKPSSTFNARARALSKSLTFTMGSIGISCSHVTQLSSASTTAISRRGAFAGKGRPAASSKAALETAAAAFDEITGVLGLLYNRKKDEVPAEVTALVEKRAAAKKAKDWATADAIRAELTAMGWAVKDTAQGPQLSKL